MPSAISAPPTLIAHASLDAMAETLAGDIAAELAAAIEARGRALIAVSGGSTPRPLYERLSQAPLDWSRVDIVLMDERWVEPGEPGSNETFIRDTLLQNRAAQARFFGLKTPGESPADGLAEAEARLAGITPPFDIALFGLGEDGHTASWFPHAEGLDAALSETGARLAAVTARKSPVTGDHVMRITLTRGAFRDCRRCLLMIAGGAKREAWAQSQEPGPVEERPVRALIDDENLDLIAHWSPK